MLKPAVYKRIKPSRVTWQLHFGLVSQVVVSPTSHGRNAIFNNGLPWYLAVVVNPTSGVSHTGPTGPTKFHSPVTLYTGSGGTSAVRLVIPPPAVGGAAAGL